MMVGFIDTHGSEFGVEPICAQLPLAPSRGLCRLGPDAHAAIAGVAVGGELPGGAELWLAARRAGYGIGRDQVAAFASRWDLLTRRRRARTTVRDPSAERPGDLVNRDFTARSRTGCGSPT